MAVEFSGVNEACLGAFGQSFTFTRFQSGETLSIAGILETGIDPEERAPGDSSVYARFWIQAGDIDPAPEKGDEIRSATTIYKIARLEVDAGGGLWLLLRQDRLVV